MTYGGSSRIATRVRGAERPRAMDGHVLTLLVDGDRGSSAGLAIGGGRWIALPGRLC